MRLFSFLRTWLATFVAFGLALAFMLASPAAMAAINFDNTPSGGTAGATGIELIRNTAAGSPTGHYVGLRVSSTVALTNVYARAILTGTGYVLDATEVQDHALGDLSGTPKNSFWFINFPATAPVAGTFRVEIYENGPPGTGSLAGTSPAYNLLNGNSDGSASASKVFSVTVNGGSSIVLGQAFDVVICYDTAASGNADGSAVTIGPAATNAFDPTGLRLINIPTVTLHNATSCGGTTLSTNSNQLFYPAAGSKSLQSTRATYTFVSMNQSSVALSPIVDSQNGGYKYNGDFATPPTGVSYTVAAATNTTTLSKTVSVTESAGAANGVTYTITATNTGAAAVTLDSFIDVLPTSPAAVTYVAGSAKFNGTAIANPLISGATLTFANPGGATAFTIPANSSRSLTFQANIPATNGAYTNNVTAKIGTVVIDTTTSTTDNVPATATTRIGPPVLTVTKTANTPTIVNTATGTTATYTIKVANTGTTAAGVSITDTALPTGFTYASTAAVTLATSASCAVAATRTTTVNPAVGATSPSWGTFSIPGGCDVSVQFVANVANTAADGTFSNSATTTTTTAPATINNFDGTPAGTTSDNVTVTSPVLAVTKTTSTPNVGPGASASYSITVTNSGTADALGVKVSDTLPAGFAYASTTSVTLNGTAVAAAGFTTGGTAGVPTWDTSPSGGFTIPAGKTLVIVFAATASTTTGTYNNSASSTSTNAKTITNFDGNAAGNTSDDVTVATIILTVTKATTTPTVVNTATGTTANYTVTVTNSGTASATGVKVSDTLAAGFTYASTTSITLNGAAVAAADRKSVV